MISFDLASTPPDEKEFSILPLNEYPCLFLGFFIKSEYDNKRLSINAKYKPKKLFHVVSNESDAIPIYGITLTPNDHVKQLMTLIQDQEKNGKISLPVYENILNQFDLSCKDTYNYFMDGLYPIDFVNLKSVCNDSFNKDKKIFQHLLSLTDTSFDFQKFASLRLMLLTNQFLK